MSSLPSLAAARSAPDPLTKAPRSMRKVIRLITVSRYVQLDILKKKKATVKHGCLRLSTALRTAALTGLRSGNW